MNGFIAPDYPDEKPDHAKVIDKCDDCGGNIYEGDVYYGIAGTIYCKECVEGFKKFA